MIIYVLLFPITRVLESYIIYFYSYDLFSSQSKAHSNKLSHLTLKLAVVKS